MRWTSKTQFAKTDNKKQKIKIKSSPITITEIKFITVATKKNIFLPRKLQDQMASLVNSITFKKEIIPILYKLLKIEGVNPNSCNEARIILRPDLTNIPRENKIIGQYPSLTQTQISLIKYKKTIFSNI